MAHLQIRDIPDALHERLKQCASKRNRSVSAIVLEAVERELDRWEWIERLSLRPPTDLQTDAATLLEEERELRDRNLSDALGLGW